MKKTNYYTALDDFLSDEFFDLWTQLQDNSEELEIATSKNPKLAKSANEVRLWRSAMNVEEVVLSPEEIKNGLENTWEKIEVKQKKDRKTSSLVLRIKKQYRRIASVAAIFILGLTAVWFYTNTYKNSEVVHQTLVGGHEQEIVDYTNSSNKNQIITLSDGSSVLLKPNSTLRYPKLFIGKNRVVHLVGEGFFEISKNPKRPFLVYANEVVTKVLGTSFRIKAYSDNQEVSVTVRTGKVEVQSSKINKNTTDKAVVLLPNQAIRFMRNKLTFDKITDLSKEKTSLDNKRNIEQYRFDFTDVAVSEIFKTMEQAYSISINYPLEKLKNCHLTTDLNDQPLPEKLKIICNSISKNTSYKITENQIIISSDGCN